MKTRPRPITKSPKLVQIVPTDLLFCDMSYKPLKISERGVQRPAFSNNSFKTSSTGLQRVAEVDVTKWHSLWIQMNLFLDRSGD